MVAIPPTSPSDRTKNRHPSFGEGPNQSINHILHNAQVLNPLSSRAIIPHRRTRGFPTPFSRDTDKRQGAGSTLAMDSFKRRAINNLKGSADRRISRQQSCIAYRPTATAPAPPAYDPPALSEAILIIGEPWKLERWKYSVQRFVQ